MTLQQRMRTCAALTAVLFLVQFAFLGFRLALTLKALHLQQPPWTVGMLLGAASLVPALTAVWMGRLVDRVGYRPPAAASALLVAVACGLAAASDRVWLLGVASMCCGSAFIMVYVSINLAVGTVAGPEHRTRAYTLLTLGMSLAGSVGAAATGWMVDRFGHAGALAALAAPAMLALGGLLGVPLLRQAPVQTAGSSRSPAAAGLLRHRPLHRVLLASALVSGSWDLFTFLVPLHGTAHGLSASGIGLVVGGFGAGAFTARLVLPAVVHRLSEWRLLLAAILLTALGYFMLPFGHRLEILVPMAFAIGLALGCGQPVLMTLTLAAAPAGRGGEAVGLRSGVSNSLSVVAPLAVGALGTAGGVAPLFWGVAVVMAAGGARVWAAGRRS